MKKLYLFIFALIGLLFIECFALPIDTYSKTKSSKHKHKSSRLHKKKSNRSNILIQESLSRLYKYCPEYFILSTESTQAKFLPVVDNINFSNSIFSDDNLRAKLIDNINTWLGTPYRFSGRSKRGIDCSNFVSCLLEETIGLRFPAGSNEQSSYFRPIKKIEDMQFGDLIFFSGRNHRSNRIGHVGFYIGNGLFAHSSTGKGVIYTHINEGYYQDRFRFGGRLNLDIITELAKN